MKGTELNVKYGDQHILSKRGYPLGVSIYLFLIENY